MTKKLLSIVLAISMLAAVSIMPQSVVAVNFSDIESSTISEAATIISDLGIMSGYADGTFLPASTVTRSEMVRYCVSLVSAGVVPAQASEEDVQFEDMYGHPDSGVVAMGYALGIVSGDGTGYFYPDVSITGEEAIKMVVATLGYGLYAQSKGGYPGGYIRVAQECGLLRGVSTETAQNATRGFVAKLLFNALTVDLMEDSYYLDDGTTTAFTITAGKNPLTEYFDIEVLYGIVEETDVSSLIGEGTLTEGLVKIGDEVFEAGLTNVSSYLGYYVSFYAMDASSSRYRTLISFNVENVRNNLITLTDEQIESVDSSVSGYTFNYWRDVDNDTKTRSVRTSSMPLVIYNGVAYAQAVEKDLMPEHGSVTLIDNDGDNRYDIVDVKSYDIVFVTSVSTSNGVISGYNYETYYLEIDEDDVTVKIFDAAGQPTTMNAIQKNSVVAIAESKTGTCKSVIVSNAPVNGSITEINKADDTYSINGTPYEVVYDVCSELSLLGIGDSGLFFLTHDGKIAGYEGSKKISNNIGLFVARGQEDGGDYKLKIYTPTGEMKDIYLASTVLVDDVEWSAKQVYDQAFTSSLFGSDGTAPGRNLPAPSASCFIYKLDSAGKIRLMDTVRGTRLTSTNPSGGDSSYYYSRTYQCFYVDDRKTFVSDNLVVFWQDEKETYDNDYSRIFSMGNRSSFSNGQSFYYPACYFYFYDGREAADIMLCYDSYDSEGSSSDKKWYSNETIKIVDHIGSSLNQLGNVTPKLYYYEGTTLRNRVFETEDVSGIENLKKGDLIHIRDYQSEIVEIAHIDTNSTTSSWNRDPLPVDSVTGESYYPYPVGRYNWNRSENQYNYGDLYYIGVVTGVNKVNQINTIDILYSSTNTSSRLSGMNPDATARGTDAQSEIVESNASVYRMKYKGDGEFSGVERVTTGSLAAGQLILLRKQGYKTNPTTGSISCRMKEAYILYEDISEMEYYRELYNLAKTINPNI